MHYGESKQIPRQMMKDSDAAVADDEDNVFLRSGSEGGWDFSDFENQLYWFLRNLPLGSDKCVYYLAVITWVNNYLS